MQAALGISRGIDRINAMIGKACMWFILASVIVSAGNAVIRKLAPTYASNSWLELQWYLFGAAFMGAAALTLQQNEHIRIDIFYATRSRRTQHWIDLLGHIFFLLPFCLIMAWLLWPYAWQSFLSGQISTNSGGLLIWPARAILFLGFLMLIFQALSEIIKKIAVMRGVMADPHPFQSATETALKEAEELAAEVAAKLETRP